MNPTCQTSLNPTQSAPHEINGGLVTAFRLSASTYSTVARPILLVSCSVRISLNLHRVSLSRFKTTVDHHRCIFDVLDLFCSTGRNLRLLPGLVRLSAFCTYRPVTMVSSEQSNGSSQPVQEELIVEEKNGVGVVTLNRPRVLNCIKIDMIQGIIDAYKKWEADETIKFVILKGNGRTFCAGGDLRMFYDLGKSDEGWTQVVYVKYWLDYHISTFKKPLVGILHGLTMGGGAGLTVPGKFRVSTEKTVFAMPEAAIGFHTDCGASYWLSHLPGALGEYMALLGARLDGAEMYSCGLATHYVSSECLPQLEARLLELDSGDADKVDAAIKEFSAPAKLGENSILNKDRLALIDKCFSKASVEEIVESLESESKVQGQEWALEPLKILKRSSPTGLKVTFQSLRIGRNGTLSDALQREYRQTINSLRGLISDDLYEGIRAVVVDKDNRPKWNPATLAGITEEKLKLMIEAYKPEDELHLPTDGVTPRWGGSWEERMEARNLAG
ncbi:hypothetical protein R1flu_004253 [Riccia fluitans]|uniref:3-hydroxyisobutyryl-CoA hydrolase n=1 Tax=Riccia fluitans TaxID=41844 RepID=A0ABD1YQQ9_9MARC